MKMKISSNLLQTAVDDLQRPHDFAFERVGYFLGDVNKTTNEIILSEWFSFDDSYYEKSDDVGALIGNAGMKMLMTTALQRKKSFFQLHLHEFQTKPDFGHTDLESIYEIVPALFRFSSATVHGAVVMGSQYLTYLLWVHPSEKPAKESVRHSIKMKEVSHAGKT